MRFCKLFQVSFVGALIFSPLMAQEAGKVHNEALKVLRGETNQPAAAPAKAPANETRAEREARLKAEAQQRLLERERVQAEKKRQFEDYVKERERLRQERQSAGTPGTVHNQAIETLRKSDAPAATTTTTAAPVTTTTQPVATPAPAAPAATPAPVTTSQPAPAPSNDEVQQRALEILRS